MGIEVLLINQPGRSRGARLLGRVRERIDERKVIFQHDTTTAWEGGTGKSRS